MKTLSLDIKCLDNKCGQDTRTRKLYNRIFNVDTDTKYICKIGKIDNALFIIMNLFANRNFFNL